MRLLIDIGNTRAKWRIDRAGGPPGSGAVAHADAGFNAALGAAWSGLTRPASVMLACVGPADVRERVLGVVRELFGEVPVRAARTLARVGELRVAYADPARLGVDRFLALLAAHQRQPQDQLVVGLGTAITVDGLRGDGQHAGGLIAPGPTLMRASLVGATPGIRPLSPGALVDLAADTEDAVASGVWHAAAGLVERAIRRAGSWAPGGVALVLHGGDAPVLARSLGCPAQVVPDLVLDGLALFDELVPAQDADGRA